MIALAGGSSSPPWRNSLVDPDVDEALSEDAMDSYHPSITLPPPELGNLAEIEQAVRAASMSPSGRDALSKFILHEEYIRKLVPLVEMAEDLESLPDLHRLCNIMKTIILLNDNYIIESVVTDGIIEGVVGALECTCRVILAWVRRGVLH